MKRNILQLATPGVSISNFFVVEVFLDLITMNVLQPVPPLLDEGTGENTFLAQLNNSLQNTKATVKNNNKTEVKNWKQDLKQQPNR